MGRGYEQVIVSRIKIKVWAKPWWHGTGPPSLLNSFIIIQWSRHSASNFGQENCPGAGGLEVIPQTRRCYQQAASGWTTVQFSSLSVHRKCGLQVPSFILSFSSDLFLSSWYELGSLRAPLTYLALVWHSALLDSCMLFVLSAPLCVCVCTSLTRSWQRVCQSPSFSRICVKTVA